MEVIHRFEQFYASLSLSSVARLEDVYHHQIEFTDPIATHHGIDNVKRYFTDLLENTKSCQCKIIQTIGSGERYSITWEMQFEHPKLNAGQPITVDGISYLEVKEQRIILHRDYFDVGQMIYEQVPILKWLIRQIKNRMKK